MLKLVFASFCDFYWSLFVQRSKEKNLFKEKTNYKSEKIGTKPPRPKESNLNRLRSRQRQIDIGKETVGYKMYVQDVKR